MTTSVSKFEAVASSILDGLAAAVFSPFFDISCHSVEPVGSAKPDATVDASPDAPPPDVRPDAPLPPPTPPLLLYPATGAKLQPFRDTFFSWQEGYIPADKEVSHYIFCYTTEGIDKIDEEIECPNVSMTENRFKLLETSTSANENYHYHWKVKACFDGNSTVCTVYSSPIGAFETGAATLLPYAQWNFDGNLNDSGPNGLHGQAPTNAGFAGPTFVANGGVCDGEITTGLLDGDKAACFDDSDGTYDYVRLSQHISSLRFGSEDDYSVEIRFRRNSNERETSLFAMEHAPTPAPAAPVFEMGSTSVNTDPEYRNRLFVGLTDNAPEAGDTSGDGVQFNSQEEIPLNNFVSAVIIYDGVPRIGNPNIAESALKLYFEGTFQDSGASDFDFLAEDFVYAAIHAAVAGNPEGCSIVGNCGGPVLIDSIAIYRRLLSEAEIINNLCSLEVLTGATPSTLPSACLNSN